MVGLVALFLILAIIFGVWGFAFTALAVIKVLFWICVALFILSLLGWGGGYYRRPPLP
jgi:uncharacterized membrane protein YtjA (UPF0391 family)